MAAFELSSGDPPMSSFAIHHTPRSWATTCSLVFSALLLICGCSSLDRDRRTPGHPVGSYFPITVELNSGGRDFVKGALKPDPACSYSSSLNAIAIQLKGGVVGVNVLSYSEIVAGKHIACGGI